MSIFKCKMCGATLEIENNASIVTCEYCGTTQTLPKIDNERRANLYDRANHFRRNNEFDKAMGIYEQILNEDNTDAEAYWSLILCRYGIEYVEDPVSHKRMPTVNRAQFTSIFEDNNYKLALQYADCYQKSIYEQEAVVINEIQKGILAISQKEEPFDVFICYKETDIQGRRTPDSVLANEIYHRLTNEGFKVFFAAITLEDKLGTAYEPYIFAALNSAKVMVVLGTKPEYFNAVWVKNEWSRYLTLVKNSGGKKMIIPAYKDMDPYELPEEFSHLQAQDMSKLGFMQDLIRGIKKLTETQVASSMVIRETVISNGNANAQSLLKRTFIFLEDGDWETADEYCERVLDIDPECGEAYLCKLMVELKVKFRQNLKNCELPFDDKNNFQKAMRFAKENLKLELQGYIDYIVNRNLSKAYNEALGIMECAVTEEEYKKAAQKFENLQGFNDSDKLARECLEKAEIARKEEIYSSAIYYMNKHTISSYKNAIELLEKIQDWKDTSSKIHECECSIYEIEQEKARLLEEQRMAAIKFARKRKIKKIVIFASIIFSIVLSNTVANIRYNNGMALMNSGRFEEAYNVFCELGEYKDAQIRVLEIETKEKIRNAKIGDGIKFGTYEQDDNFDNGKEDIEWIVLDVKNGNTLIISKDALDCKPYNIKNEETTWENCTLREWLNSEFFDTAFAEWEKEIIKTRVSSENNDLGNGTNADNAIEDRIFLLNITEVNDYFASDDVRLCKATDYAIANGAWNDDDDNCWYWLASQGFSKTYASIVNGDGFPDDYGLSVTYDGIAVRPALWIETGNSN